MSLFRFKFSEGFNVPTEMVGLSGYGIVAAWIQRVATADPLHSQPSSLEDAVLFDGLVSILGAGRRETAGWR